MIHKLHSYQVMDKARGMFLIKLQIVKKLSDGTPVYASPADRDWEGHLVTYPTTILFTIVD